MIPEWATSVIGYNPRRGNKCDWNCVEVGEHDLVITGVLIVKLCAFNPLKMLNLSSKSLAWL